MFRRENGFTMFGDHCVLLGTDILPGEWITRINMAYQQPQADGGQTGVRFEICEPGQKPTYLFYSGEQADACRNNLREIAAAKSLAPTILVLIDTTAAALGQTAKGGGRGRS